MQVKKTTEIGYKPTTLSLTFETEEEYSIFSSLIGHITDEDLIRITEIRNVFAARVIIRNIFSILD